MKIAWRAFRQRSQPWLKTAWLIAAVLLAIHSGVIRPLQAFRGIAQSKATGLAAIESNRHWLVPLPQSVDNAVMAEGIVGGVPGAFSPVSASYLSSSENLADRKLVRTSSIELLVKHPADAAEKIRSLT